MGKYLGQHFLINKNKLRKIIEVLDLKLNDTIIEIGPGHGELTRELKVKSLKLKVVALEKDKKFVQVLQKKFASDRNIKIIEGDVLKILKSYVLILKSYKLVGNIPYYITGYLLRILGELKNKPLLTVLTIQKEVAKRICALRQAQGKPKMNLLAASVQFWAEPEIIDYISRRDFKPQPKVDSAIIRLDPKPFTLNAKPYYKFIKVLFKQPRKTILNNLVEANKREYLREKMRKEEIIKKLTQAGINPSNRPQNLTLKQLLKLSTLF